MAFSINMGEAIPELGIKEIVSGQTSDYKIFIFDLEAATTEEVEVVNSFLNLVGGHATINIINAPHDFNDFIFVAQTNIELDIIEVDYSTLLPEEVEVVDAFANLAISKANLEI